MLTPQRYKKVFKQNYNLSESLIFINKRLKFVKNVERSKKLNASQRILNFDTNQQNLIPKNSANTTYHSKNAN